MTRRLTLCCGVLFASCLLIGIVLVGIGVAGFVLRETTLPSFIESMVNKVGAVVYLLSGRQSQVVHTYSISTSLRKSLFSQDTLLTSSFKVQLYQSGSQSTSSILLMDQSLKMAKRYPVLLKWVLTATGM